MTFKISMNPFPIPKTQSQLRLAFSWEYCEEESGATPAAFAHKTGSFTLENLGSNDGGKSEVYTGLPDPYGLPSNNLPITGHSYGLYFKMFCNNRSDVVNNKLYWRRFISHDAMTKLLEDSKSEGSRVKEISIAGSSPFVPNGKSKAEATLNLIKKNGIYYIHDLRIEFSLRYWDLWYDVVCSEQEQWDAGLMEINEKLFK
jgi:hypothetical protein